MKPRGIGAVLVLLSTTFLNASCELFCSISSCEPHEPRRPETMEQGLTAEDKRQLFHLGEGSEVLPLAFFRALERADERRPFAQDLERFGLLPDPDNPDGLPIGITAELSEIDWLDIKWLEKSKSKRRLIGVNCAACHVGQFRVDGVDYQVLGAPNLFDVETFFTEMARALKATVQSPGKLFRFVVALSGAGSNGLGLAAQMGELPKELSSLDRGGQLEIALAARVREIVQEESVRPAADLRGALGGDAPEPAIAMSESPPLAADPELTQLIQDRAARSDLFSGETEDKTTAISNETLERVRAVIQLVKARLALVAKLAAPHETGDAVQPTVGRVDAFGSARRLLFDEQPGMDAPVRYPRLWELEKIEWLHWDGNTNSLMERNLGQAIGLGAIYVPATHTSTLLPMNIGELETIAQKIRPPKWPWPLDDGRVAKGEQLFEREGCSGCHGDVSRSVAWSEVRTDPRRIDSFTTPLTNGRPFAEALGEALAAVKEKAYTLQKVTPEQRVALEAGRVPVTWRGPQSYVARPLHGIWASPPYLHNGSVPTLYDLLSRERPSSFRVGGREYDTRKVGYESSGPDVFDAMVAGNRNQGHDFGTGITEDERYDLIEFLKSL
jgi:hypothetical protein